MRVEHLNLSDIRNIASCDINPAPGVNFIHGRNGQGKTNLVEAVHYLSNLDFHRGSAEDFIKRGSESGRIVASVEVEGFHRSIDITIENRKTQIKLDGDPVKRARNYLGQVLSVAFFPEDMLLLLAEPVLRRKWLDTLISLYHLPYRDTLSAAKRALDSRNRLLRDPIPPDTALMNSIDTALAPHAAEIIFRRGEIIGLLETRLKQIYAGDFDGAGEPSMEYLPSFAGPFASAPEVITQAYRASLFSGRERDVAARMTLKGPHRDDFTMYIDRKPVRVFASRGEVRTALLCLNLSRLGILRDKYKRDPIVILDDILSELDIGRRRKVLHSLPKSSQVFITSTDRDGGIADEVEGIKYWYVDEGKILEDNG